MNHEAWPTTHELTYALIDLSTNLLLDTWESHTVLKSVNMNPVFTFRYTCNECCETLRDNYKPATNLSLARRPPSTHSSNQQSIQLTKQQANQRETNETQHQQTINQATNQPATARTSNKAMSKQQPTSNQPANHPTSNHMSPVT